MSGSENPASIQTVTIAAEIIEGNVEFTTPKGKIHHVALGKGRLKRLGGDFIANLTTTTLRENLNSIKFEGVPGLEVGMLDLNPRKCTCA